jgi:tetratricopeptide (TPR) repeat protein
MAFPSLRWFCFCMIPLETLVPSGRVRAQICGPALPANSSTSAADQKRLLGELVRQTKWGEAAPVAQALAEAYPNDPNWPYWLGTARWRLEDPIGAIRALRSAETLGMDTAPLHKMLGLAYYSINQFILFKAQMERASQLDPLDNEPIYSLGRYRESLLNDYSGALKLFERSVQLKPDHSKSVYYKGHCQEMLDLRAEALDTFQKAVALVDKNRETFSLPYQGMARLLLENDPAQALTFARKAVELEPDLDSGHATLARTYELQGRLWDAEQEFQIVVRLNPNNPTNHYILSRFYMRLGQQDAAQAQLETFRKLRAVYESQ